MTRVACFVDTEAIASAVLQEFSGNGHDLRVFSASHLSPDVRKQVQLFSPDLVLLEFTHTIDNPHLYFFLRIDPNTRHVPVLLLSEDARVEQTSVTLEADGYVQCPFPRHSLRAFSVELLPMERFAAA